MKSTSPTTQVLELASALRLQNSGMLTRHRLEVAMSECSNTRPLALDMRHSSGSLSYGCNYSKGDAVLVR